MDTMTEREPRTEKEAWVRWHDPELMEFSPISPLTLGNGSIAFTADITGLQSFSSLYAASTPLCTLSEWGWHTAPVDDCGKVYTPADLHMTEYAWNGLKVTYATDCHPGNEDVYRFLRENPHKMNLARIGFCLNGHPLEPGDITGICQHLHLYSGILESLFRISGVPCRVLTLCAPEEDTLLFSIESPLLASGLSVDLSFPYGSPDIGASDWTQPGLHTTVLRDDVIFRHADDLDYRVRLSCAGAAISQLGQHQVRVSVSGQTMNLAVSFSRGDLPDTKDPDTLTDACRRWWADFWEEGGMIDLTEATDPRAKELGRRIVLSLYLLTVNSASHMPPAETGLTCNSWYGKAHLEMHFWHMAWAPLWGHAKLLERSIPWYLRHLADARASAARNGYRGARWPKMVAEDAQDSPSSIAPLLIWQQPHIILLLDLILRSMEDEEDQEDFCRAHWGLIRETADFMADFAVPAEDGLCHILPPVYPVQERYDPREITDPAFEVAYWKMGLEIAIKWAKRLGQVPDPKWETVAATMAPPPVRDGLYVACSNLKSTDEIIRDDHPSMLQCLGLLPGKEIKAAIMERTLQDVISSWDRSSLWGWDFAVMALTALRLGKPNLAMDLLMSGTEKNTYVTSGNNRQGERQDLPLYLPGNGSLLLACAVLGAGWDGREGVLFPETSGWKARCHGLHPWYG